MRPSASNITHMGSGLTSLSRAELKRRIEAARILRGISQEELDRRFAEDGLGKSAGRLERGDKRLTLNRALLDGFIRHLRVPESWFTAEDVDELVYPSGAPDLDGLLSRIEASLHQARVEANARGMEVRQLLDERLPPIREVQSRRRA